MGHRYGRTCTPPRRGAGSGTYGGPEGAGNSPVILDSRFGEDQLTTPESTLAGGAHGLTPACMDANTCRPICCCEIVPSEDPGWRWPCSCRLQLHLNCAAQLRLRNHRPQCPHCRMAWPGVEADRELQVACEEHGVHFSRNWQQLPVQAEPEDPVIPAEPHDLVVLCCERLIALNISAASRRMTWAPIQQFETNDLGCRMPVGWIGNWVCNSCGRTVDQHDDRLSALRVNHACALQSGCRLCLDLQNGSYAWMCGATGQLSDEPRQTDARAPMPLQSSRTANCVANLGYFAGLPPTSNDEATNSFLYCPLLLHAGGLLQDEVVRAWANAIPWFEAACQCLRNQTCELGFVAQAYAELLQIACQHDASMMQCFSRTGDAAAAQHLAQLATQSHDVVGLAVVLPGVVDVHGHIPNQLQDLLLQVFGGLRLASDLESAVTAFRNTGSWPVDLSSLSCDSSGPSHVRQQMLSGPHRVPNGHAGLSLAHGHAAASNSRFNASACNRSSSEPSRGVMMQEPSVDAVDLAPVLRINLHEHACSRHVTSRFGALRRCSVCNMRLAREVSYFRCGHGCRFAACVECFQAPVTPCVLEQDQTLGGSVPSRVRAAPDAGEEVDSAALGASVPVASVPPQLTRFTRFVCEPRDEFARRIREMIDSGQFSGIGRPDLRMEGPTAWGVWLRIFPAAPPRDANNGRGARARCGVLYHVSQMTVFFHGDEQVIRESLLPLFESWTYTSIDVMPQRIPEAPALPAPPPLEVSQCTPGSNSGELPNSLASGVSVVTGHRTNCNVVPECDGQIESGCIASLQNLPRLVEELIQGQAQLQHTLSTLSSRLDLFCSVPPVSSASNPVAQGAQAPGAHPPPGQHDVRVPPVPPPPPARYPRPVSREHADTNHAELAPDVRVCRRANCRNSCADACRTGFCPSHCSSRRCPCNVSLADAPAAAAVQSPRSCRRPGCQGVVATSCRTGFCAAHCFSPRCSCTQGPPRHCGTSVPTAPPTQACRRHDCDSEVGPNCTSGYCAFHCYSRSCACRTRLHSVPAQPPDRNAPPRRRVCSHDNCWVLVQSNCRTGFCPQHCARYASTSCPCRDAPLTRRCRRHGCAGLVADACRTGYCEAHCVSPRCCGQSNSRSGHPWTSSVIEAPLRRYLFEMCSGLPDHVDHLPAHIRTSLEELRTFAQEDVSGNGGGPRRIRQHRGGRTI